MRADPRVPGIRGHRGRSSRVSKSQSRCTSPCRTRDAAAVAAILPPRCPHPNSNPHSRIVPRTSLFSACFIPRYYPLRVIRTLSSCSLLDLLASCLLVYVLRVPYFSLITRGLVENQCTYGYSRKLYRYSYTNTRVKNPSLSLNENSIPLRVNSMHECTLHRCLIVANLADTRNTSYRLCTRTVCYLAISSNTARARCWTRRPNPFIRAPYTNTESKFPGGPFHSASPSLSLGRSDPRSLLGGGECGGTRTRTRYRPRCGHYYAVTPRHSMSLRVCDFPSCILFSTNKRLTTRITRLTISTAGP